MMMNKADSIVEENTVQEEVIPDEELAQEPTQETTVEETVASDEPNSSEIETSESDIPQESDSDASKTTDSEHTDDSTPETIDGEPDSDGDEPAQNVEAEQPTEEAPFVLEKAPYHERYYLKYQGGNRITELDLTGTRAFLQSIGFDGGELKQAREGKDCAENLRNMEQNKGSQTVCSYCGKEISGIDFYKLPDGRVRCTTCSNTIIKTKAEIEELFERVIDNLETFFGATIDVPISIEVTDERKLKKKVGVPLGTKDDQSILILGVAISKKKKYSIILENGAPRISLIATFAHELTHIWQYTHWDNNKKFKDCPKDKRLLIYEGMAKWAEIQYLYLVGETAVAKREEYITRNREDEYGVGFCMYEDVYPLSRETMTCEETPFTPDKYPI